MCNDRTQGITKNEVRCVHFSTPNFESALEVHMKYVTNDVIHLKHGLFG